MAARKEKIADEFDRRKRAEKEAHVVVEKLLEDNVKEDFFLSSLKKLTVQHYDDVTEERSLSSDCGYCLCPNKIKEVPQQQYKINKNKVYDITQRKKFCSNRCYALSLKIREQISSTPLWLRNFNEIPDIQIPGEIESGLRADGEEIPLRYVILKKDVEAIPSEEKSSDDSTTQLLEAVSDVSGAVMRNPPHEARVTKVLEPTKNNETRQQKKQINIADSVFSILREWITHKTKEFLGMAESSQKPGKESQITDSETSTQQILLENRLDQLFLGTDSPSESSASKPVPDYKTLQENVQKFEEKVSSFYGSSLQIKEKAPPKTPKDAESQDDSIQPQLPVVDSKNQMAIRQKIVTDRLKRTIDSLTPPLPNISQDIRFLARTFRLTSKNVMLSTEMWPVISISLLNLLAIKNQHLRESLASEDMDYILKILLKPYNLNQSYIKSSVFGIIEQPIIK